MNNIYIIIVVVQVLAALTIIGLVLLQHGKGADMGAAFGSGASGSLFGASGSSNFLSKSTGIAAAIFFAATLALAYISGNRLMGSSSNSVLDNLPTAPAAPAIVKPAANTPSPQPVQAAPAQPAAPAAPVAPSNQIPK